MCTSFPQNRWKHTYFYYCRENSQSPISGLHSHFDYSHDGGKEVDWVETQQFKSALDFQFYSKLSRFERWFDYIKNQTHNANFLFRKVS